LKAGDVVVMDNLSSHHRAGGRAAIEAAGAELRLQQNWNRSSLRLGADSFPPEK
jgi:hypothetical protein